MLKALELSGFKSFADKTRFEFPSGITVVVGPNGSGKSNIVDAIKWVLGEQSAKSLRGKDMADVIFKGSGGAGGRKPQNTAEATIVIDNSEGRIAIDAPEVHVTRRVYRSGEGEYLINRQPCRLRDIKDLFRGTGVGTDAYSLIEQGKVDRLLQASAKDRRAIFEEAAGISRFKAKKIEAQRRLERVDQNMLRLTDIVDEVESRLRSVRAQASKARRYKEYSDRMQQLRTQVGLVDWRHLSERLEAIETELAELRQQAAEDAAQIERQEARLLELELEINNHGEEIRSCENRFARNRERIAGLESTIAHGRSRRSDLDEEEAQQRRQLAAMSTRVGDLQQRLSETSTVLERADSEHRRISSHVAEHEREVADLTEQHDRLRSASEARRAEYVEAMRTAATLGNEASGYEAQLRSTEATAGRCEEQLVELERECSTFATDLRQRRGDEERLAGAANEKNKGLETAQNELSQCRGRLAIAQASLSEMQARFSGASQRTQVLEDLEQRLEGLDAGVEQVLQQAKDNHDGPLGAVRGLVADLVQAEVDVAALVDVALGERAHHVVVADSRFVKPLETEALRITGRVGFIRLDIIEAERQANLVDLTFQPGVISRADRTVSTDPKYEPLLRHLLSDTWFVETLAHAISLSRSVGRRQRFVTRGGQLVQRDGTLIVGSHLQVTGIVSRRSQLRALQIEIEDLERRITDAKADVGRQQDSISRLEQTERTLQSQYKQAADALNEARVEANAVQQRFEQAEKQRQTVNAELRAAASQQQSIGEQLNAARNQLSAVEVRIASAELAMQGDEEEIDRIQRQRQQHIQLATDAKIEMAKSTQQLEGLRVRLAQFEEDQQERKRSIQQVRDQLEQCRRRGREADRDVLKASSKIAELYLKKERLARDTVELIETRRALSGERTSLSSDVQKVRKTLRQLEDRQHQAELSAGEVQHQRASLAERMREDYGIELADVTHQPSEEELHERETVEEEIASLRRKINNIGAVNMEALGELEELEDRFGSLSGQHQDLVSAKDALERIIHKINADSRRLFTETLEAIRLNFQGLFRKAFGGGQADIVLEPDVDILEAGIEIIATPPGKPQFNNSLLSGGEKALTAVSLLLAIFQYRPSPFCVLDEVDAPFDEANIGRFVGVLNEFLGWTKFVVVTHSKKTMTAANTLYGVTMQESGVSKQVSVRFEDVSEDGHISDEAIQRQQAEDAA